MEPFSLYNGCNPTALYLPFQALSPDANIRDLPFEDWDLPDDRAYSDSGGLDYALKRTKLQPIWPLSTLPVKRSVHDLPANQCQDVEQASLLPTTKIDSFKRIEETVTLPLPSPHSSERTTSPEEIFGSSPRSTSTEVRLTEWDHNDDIAARDGSRYLLSPIKFTPPRESNLPNLASSEPSNKGNGSSTYLFYPPGNPADKPPQTSDAHRNVPRQQLSYGESIHTPKPKSLHRATGSSELRRKAGWETDDDDLGSWEEGSLKASSIRPWFSEPAPSKPRLWLDLAGEGERLEEAHATTVTSSPTKPQLICIPRRRATTTTTDSAPTPILREQRSPNIFPATPLGTPASPLGLSIDSLAASKQEKERLAFERIKAKQTWTTTPPTIANSTPDSSETLRHISTLKTRPDTPRPFQSPVPQLSELTTWILNELEHSVSSHGRHNLQLNSPVTQQLRLPPAQRRVPRSPPPTLPLSRYSTYNPLSSHPPSIPISTVNPPSTSSAPLPALRTIFPHAALSLLDALHATIVAHHHVSSIHLPSPTPSPYPSPPSPPHSHPPPPALQNTPLLHPPDTSYIPSKARAMLGLQPSTTSRPVRPTLPSSWLTPQVLSWGERVEELEVGLSKEVARLIEECLARDMHGKGEGEAEGALARAVGDVVRLDEGGRT